MRLTRSRQRSSGHSAVAIRPDLRPSQGAPKLLRSYRTIRRLHSSALDRPISPSVILSARRAFSRGGAGRFVSERVRATFLPGPVRCLVMTTVRIAASFQGVSGHDDSAGDQAVAPLVVAADVDQQSAAGLRVQGFGGRGTCGSMALAWAGSSSTVLPVPRPAMSSSRSGDIVSVSLADRPCRGLARTGIADAGAVRAAWPMQAARL